MSVSPATPATTAVPRTWRSLLTGRWHRSSWVVAALVLLLLVFCNLPGQLVTEIDFDRWDLVGPLIHRVEHGWPLSWAMRGDAVWGYRDLREISTWTFWKDHPQYHWYALAVDGIVVIVLTLVVGATFEVWRRARRHLWQSHLRDFLVVILLLSLAGAWFAAARNRYANEWRVIGPNLAQPLGYWERWEKPIHGIHGGQRTIGGITWLRERLGHEPFQFLDRTIQVQADPQGLPWVAQLPDIRAVQVSGDLTSGDLRPLEQLPKLEFLSIYRPVESPDESNNRTSHSVPRLTMPYLPRLRSLDTTNIDWDGWSNLPALESLWWSGEPVDEATFRQLAALPKLRRLRLTRCVFSAAGLSHLRSQRSLRCLFLSGPIDRDLMREIGRLTQLGELDLTGGKFDPAALSHLAPLTQLETLDLCLTPVDDKTLDHLPPLANLRNLDLSGTKVTSSAIEALARRRQLRNLMVDAESFTPEERQRLEAALPECQMWYTHIGP